MERLGLNDTQLAKRVGVSRTAVGFWKSDTNVPKHKLIPRLAGVLGLEPSDLSPYGATAPPMDEDGNTSVVAYLRRIDNTVNRMAEDIGQVKTRLASLESRVTGLEATVHKRLDALQKQIDNIGARLDRWPDPKGLRPH